MADQHNYHKIVMSSSHQLVQQLIDLGRMWNLKSVISKHIMD